jgi:subtilisin-like proprotein convertase family protein
LKTARTLAAFAIAALFTALGAHAGTTISQTLNPALAVAPDNGCTDDNNTGTGLGGVSTTMAFTEAGTLSDVNVEVHFTHTWRSDLQMVMSYTGGGGTVRLANAHGNSANSDNYHATFDSDAGVACGDASQCNSVAVGGGPCQSAPGPTCSPDQSLTAYNGLTSPGTWTITICDRVAQDLGTLNSWTITLTGDPLPVELMNFSID